MNFPIFVPKGEVIELLSPLRRHILTVVVHQETSIFIINKKKKLKNGNI